jgi:hypothetical protein
VIGADEDRQIAGYIPALDGIDANAFEVLGKSTTSGVLFEHAAIAQPTRPGASSVGGIDSDLAVGGLPWFHPMPRQRAASAALSVALGRIAADVLA